MSVFPVLLTQSVHQNHPHTTDHLVYAAITKGNIPREAAAKLPDLLCTLTHR